MRIIMAIPQLSTDSTSAEGKQLRKVVSKCAASVGSVKIANGALVFSIDGAFGPRSSDTENARALEALMLCLCQLDLLWLRLHPSTLPLYDSGVYYDRTMVWDTIPMLYARGYGDCKSLAACRIAENWQKGIWCKPTFRFDDDRRRSFSLSRTGAMFHILVMYEDGSWEDPSKALGMIPPQEKAS